jgi:hypothetical protein
MLMAKFICLLVFCVSAYQCQANSSEYVSVGNPSIILDERQQTYFMGDIQGSIDFCQTKTVKHCVIYMDEMLAIPTVVVNADNIPSRDQLMIDFTVMSLPIEQSYTILSQTIKGRLITIKNIKSGQESRILYTNDLGIVYMTFRGIGYWLSTECGLFAAKSCHNSK